jgi:hypothetical protein
MFSYQLRLCYYGHMTAHAQFIPHPFTVFNPFGVRSEFYNEHVVRKLNVLKAISVNRPRKPIRVFRVGYEHHLHIEKKTYPRNRPCRLIDDFCEVRTSCTFKKRKAIPAIGRVGPQVCFL